MDKIINAEQLTEMLIYGQVQSVKELDEGWMIECQDMDFDINDLMKDEDECLFIWDTPLKFYHCSAADFVTAKTNAIKEHEDSKEQLKEELASDEGLRESFQMHEDMLKGLGTTVFDELWGC